MTTAEILRGARPRRWRKNEYGPDRSGRCCLVGACAVVSGEPVVSIEHGPVGQLLKECSGASTPSAFNDRTTTKHADVLAVLDCAIAKAKAPA